MSARQKRNRACTIGALLVATVASAADRTWNGGGSDANWSTAANWGGTAPSAGDVLMFAGSTRLTNTNDLSDGTAIGGITFNTGASAFVLAGNGVSMLGAVTNFSVSSQTINLPLTLAATRVFCASNGALMVSNTISGAGGLTVAGAQPLTLAAGNTYSGATTVKPGGVLRVTHGNALGSAAGTTTAEDGGLIELYGGIMVPESFTLYGDSSTGYGGVLRNKSGSNIVTGVILNGSRIKTNTGSLDLLGGVTGGQFVLGADAGTFIRIAEKSINIGGNTFFAHTSAPIILAVTNNTWGTLEVSGHYVYTEVDNALAVSGLLRMGGSSPSGVNLNGHNQTVGQLLCTYTASGTREVTSVTPATLTVNQSATTTYNGTFSGAVSLVKAGSGTLALSNAVSSMTGSLVVSNGTLVIESSGGFSACTNVIVAGGTLELRKATALSSGANLLIAAAGAKVTISNGLAQTVGSLFIGGVQQARGTYGTVASGANFTDDVRFGGTGQLNVLNSPAVAFTTRTWDAGGADAYMSTAANWEGDAVPSFDGTVCAVFGTGGNSVTSDVAVALYGMTFNRDGNFTLAAGAGIVSNGAGGVFAQAPNATARTYAIAEDMVLSDNQTWMVGTNNLGVTTLNVTGSIGDGVVPCGITKTEFGTLNLYTNNTFDGAVVVSNGALRIYNSFALGSTNGNTTVHGWAGCNLYLYGNLNIAEPLVLNGEKNNAGTLRIDSGSNTLSGPITLYNQVRLVVYTGALAVEGGMIVGSGDPGGSLVINSGTATYFRNKPLQIGTKNFYTDSGGLTVVAVTNNMWGETQVMSGTLRLDVTNALPVAPLRLGVDYGPGGTVDLNGNDQTVNRLYLGTANPAVRTVASVAPALLTVNQNANTLFDARFTGAVSLLKAGTGSLTLTNAFTTTTGSFAVSNGTLAVVRDGTFGPNSTNIAVFGTGTLLLSNSVAIADSAAVTMPASGVSTAKISLASGVNEKVGQLFYGNKMQRVGSYGSTGSAALFKDDSHFAGTGVLTVLRDNSGTLFKLH